MIAPIVTGPVANNPIADIQARVAVVESRFGVGRAPATPSPGTVDFDALLRQLTGDSGPGSVRSASGYSGSAGYLGLSGWSGQSGLSGPGSGTAGQVVGAALEHLGTPYVWGGDRPGGFDCSGLVQHAYRQIGVELPRTSAEQARVGRPVASLADARPGDLVAFNSPVDHIGIYAGNGQMVVAPKRGDVVKVQPIYAQPTAIRRVLLDNSGGL